MEERKKWPFTELKKTKRGGFGRNFSNFVLDMLILRTLIEHSNEMSIRQMESAWNPLCPCLGCWEQGVPMIVLFVAAFRLLPSASDARWSRSRRGEQAALPASSPAVPDTRARRLCLSLPSHPSSDSGSGSRPSIPLTPLDHQGSERLHTPRPALRGSRHNKRKSARTPLSLHLRGVITG